MYILWPRHSAMLVTTAADRTVVVRWAGRTEVRNEMCMFTVFVNDRTDNLTTEFGYISDTTGVDVDTIPEGS